MGSRQHNSSLGPALSIKGSFVTEDRPSLQAALPDFTRELRGLLQRGERADLARQLPDLRIMDRCVCDDHFCATFYTAPKPTGSWGSGHETIVLDHEFGMVNIDVVKDRSSPWRYTIAMMFGPRCSSSLGDAEQTLTC
jgi:hypothetical protein